MSKILEVNFLPSIDNEFNELMITLFDRDYKTKVPTEQQTEMYRMFCSGWLACVSVIAGSVCNNLEPILMGK